MTWLIAACLWGALGWKSVTSDRWFLVCLFALTAATAIQLESRRWLDVLGDGALCLWWLRQFARPRTGRRTGR